MWALSITGRGTGSRQRLLSSSHTHFRPADQFSHWHPSSDHRSTRKTDSDTFKKKHNSLEQRLIPPLPAEEVVLKQVSRYEKRAQRRCCREMVDAQVIKTRDIIEKRTYSPIEPFWFRLIRRFNGDIDGQLPRFYPDGEGGAELVHAKLWSQPIIPLAKIASRKDEGCTTNPYTGQRDNLSSQPSHTEPSALDISHTLAFESSGP